MSHFNSYAYFLFISLFTLSCAAQDSKSKIPATAESDAPSMYRDEVQLYSDFCASCHGSDARAFADRRSWAQGSSFENIKDVIKYGLPDAGMPEFGASFSEEEIAALTKYIIDAKDQVATYDFTDEFDDQATFSYRNHDYKLVLVTDQVEIPWGIAQSKSGELFYGDKKGELIKINSRGEHVKIKGLPAILDYGQGGLMDILLDPEFEQNQMIYFSYSKPNPENKSVITTAVFKGQLENDQIINGKDIWVALPYLPTRYHFGSRMIWDNAGHLYVTIGDRGRRDENPQSLSVAPGKVHRIHSDGTIPEDNPFVQNDSAVPSIFSYGHRNPQGIVYDASNDIIYENEHGPRGGDEINMIKKGKNYGWPIISYGINYNGTVFTEKTEQGDMEQPMHYWVPAIGVCGMAFVSSNKYPNWKNHILSGSLKYEYLSLTPIINGKISEEIRLFPKIGRLRSVIQGTDGYIYIGVEKPGRIYRVLPQ